MEEFAMQVCCQVIEKDCENAVPKCEAFDFMRGGFGGGLVGPELENDLKQSNPLFLPAKIEDNLHCL
jgi:hypothetical protein